MAKPNTVGGAASYVLSLLRIVAGVMYLVHGLQLTFGLVGGHRMSLTSFLGIGGIIELIGGTFIVLGLFTRPVALVLCGQMAVAYLKVHAPRSPIPAANGGELAVLYCFLFLYFVFAGGGAMSLDNMARGRS